MVKYLSKFVLEVLPSVVATVVGAYIVAHYINPKPDTPKTEVVATVPAPEAKDAADTTGTVEDKAGEAKPADAKAADGKPAEAAKIDSAKIDSAKIDSTKIDSTKTRARRPRASRLRLQSPTRRRTPSNWPARPSSACAERRSIRRPRPRRSPSARRPRRLGPMMGPARPFRFR